MKQELQQISPSTIERGEITFNLYAMRKGKLVLFCKQGFNISDAHMQSLKTHNQSFYINKADWKDYIKYAQDSVKSLIEDKSVDPGVRAKALHTVNKEHLKSMLDNPYAEEVKQQSVDAVDNYVRYIISAPNAVSNLFALASLDVYTYSHSLNVCTLSILMAQLLKPDDKDTMITYGMAGLMHDMGKTKIDDKIITKEGRLTEEEFEQIKLHPVYSDEIIRHHGFSQEVLEAGRSHHERITGGGYPDNLKGREISPIARMMAVIDVYDALTSRRSYKAEIRNIEALKIMHQQKEGFDQNMFNALLTLVTQSNSKLSEVAGSDTPVK